MIYSPDSARRTPGAAAVASAYDGAKEVGLILANVAFREGWKIGSGGWLRVLFDWIGVFMEAGTGSQVQYFVGQLDEKCIKISEGGKS